MKALILLAGLAAAPAHADLYRWIDPESGSVKYSSVAPPWYGDAGRERAPAVEVLPYRPAGIPLEKAKEDSAVSVLEARQQQLEAYQGLVAELDRQDPGGAARRRAQEAAVMEKLQKGLEAQLGPRSPVGK